MSCSCIGDLIKGFSVPLGFSIHGFMSTQNLYVVLYSPVFYVNYCVVQNIDSKLKISGASSDMADLALDLEG